MAQNIKGWKPDLGHGCTLHNHMPPISPSHYNFNLLYSPRGTVGAAASGADLSLSPHAVRGAQPTARQVAQRRKMGGRMAKRIINFQWCIMRALVLKGTC